MTCPDYNQLLAFVERSGAEEQRELIQEHIDNCPSCFGAVVELAESLSEDAAIEVGFEKTEAAPSPPKTSGRSALAATRPGGGISQIPAVRTELLLGAPGTDFDHFRVIRTLGRGGMGEVYLARDMQLGRKVALKVIKPELLGSEELLARFLFEAKTTARFNHPHIVTIYGAGQVSGVPYVALEYLEGQDLQSRITSQPPTLHETLRIVLAVSEAIEEAHKHGILHRDLKPANVLIPTDGRVRVVDFGLALAIEDRPLTDDDESLSDQPIHESRQDGLRGTPTYMAPEQWRGEECTPATDVWALGLMLFELCTGGLPITKRTSELLRKAVCSDEPMPVSLPLKDTPERVSTLVEHCLRKDPSRRPEAAHVVEELRDMVYEGRRLTVEGESPFRGLLPFTERHSHWFFGRDREIAHCVEHLRHAPLVAVVGSSGAGKSSFVQAGVIPRLREQAQWTILRLRPGQHPMRRLAAKLVAGMAGETGSRAPLASSRGHSSKSSPAPSATPNAADKLAEQLMANPGQLALSLAELAAAQDKQVLLLVDQMEEVFTQTTDAAEQTAFVEALCTAVDDPTEPVRVMLTLRDDFLGHLARSTDSAKHILQDIVVLKKPSKEALRQTLVKPLEMVGYHYEDPAIVDAMLAAVESDGALPLLQFTARMLWDRRDVKTLKIKQTDYYEIGGVQGALAQHAETVLQRFTVKELGVARTLFLRMVTPERTRRTQPRRNLIDGLGEHGDRVLNHLTKSRLISTRRTDDMSEHDAVYEFAHESLIDQWPTLSRWLEESSDEIEFINEVGQAAELWDKRGRRGAELWTDDALRNAVVAQKRATTPVPTIVQEFIEEGQKRDARRRLRRRVLAVMLPVILAAAATVFAFQKTEADYQRDAAETERARAVKQRSEAVKAQGVAEQERVNSLLENARGALKRSRPLEARAKLRMAAEQASQIGPAMRGLWWQLSNDPHVWSKNLASFLYATAWSPTGSQIAVASQNRTIHLLDADTRAMRVLRDASDQVHSVAFSPKGKLLVSGDRSGQIYVHDTAGAQLLKTWTGHKGRVGALAFNPKNGSLASAGVKGRVRIWEADTGKEIKALNAAAVDLAFNADGSLLAAGSSEQVWVWRTSDWQQFDYKGKGPRGQRVAFLSNPPRLVTGGKDGRVRLWDPQTGILLKTLGRHAKGVQTLSAHSATGQIIAGHPHEINVWDAASERNLGVFRDRGPLDTAISPRGDRAVSVGAGMYVRVWHMGRVDAQTVKRMHRAAASVSFTPDSKTLASSAIDGSLGLWDVKSGRLIGGFRGLSGGLKAEYSPNGKLLAFAGWKGLLQVRHMPSTKKAFIVQAHLATIGDVSFSPDGQQIATVSDDGSAKLWDTRGTLIRTIKAHNKPAFVARFSPDGQALATGGGDYSVRIWDVKTGEERHHITGPKSAVFALDWSPDGRQVAFAGQAAKLWIWTVDSKEPARAFSVQGRINALRFHPKKQLIAVASANNTVQLVDDQGTLKALLRGPIAEVNEVAFSPDGRLVAASSDDGRIRTWEVDRAIPHWRATALVKSPAQLLTQNGWQPLGATEAASPAAPQWGQAAHNAAHAVESQDGTTLCTLDADSTLRVWKRNQGKETATLSGVRQVVATQTGCLVRRGERITLCTANNPPKPLQVPATANGIGAGKDALLVATSKQLFRFDDAGQLVETRPLLGGVTAMTYVDGGVQGHLLVMGHRDGLIELSSKTDAGDALKRSLLQVPSSPVLHLAAGPPGTLMAGFADGTVGLWALSDGLKIRMTRLHGRIQHLVLDKETMHAASDLGDSVSWSLKPFYSDQCALLNEMWQRVPVIWKNGRAVRRGKPANHPCAKEAP